MFLSVPVVHSIDFEGQKLELQTGLLAKQATQTVLAKIGETTVLAAVVVGKEKSGDYFPLQIVYEERLYAAGKIKGSRFVKREGKPTDNAVLTGRMVDRSLRSLFSPYLRTEIQVVITVLSLDNVNPPDTLAVIAASSALSLCGLLPKENLPNFDFCDSHQKTWPKNSEIRKRTVAIIQVKNTEKFVSFTKKDAKNNAEEFYKDGYFLPGGGIEIGENRQETAARETLEELGIGNLVHLESLGKCQISLPYDGNISQNVEFYEWFEIEKTDLENLQKAEKDEQNWEIEIVTISELRTNNWPQLNMILDKLEDRILAKGLDLLSLKSQNLEIEDLEVRNLQTEKVENNLDKFVSKLENTKIFTGPVSSVRLGLEIEPLGGIFLKKIEDLFAIIDSEEMESWKEILSKEVLEKNEEDSLENSQEIQSENSGENEDSLSKLQKIILEIAQSLDKNNSEDLDFIRQIGSFLGRQKPFLAIYFKEVYKKTTRLSRSETWAKYPTKFNFVINPSYEIQTLSKMDLVVSGNGQNIVMVECGAKIIPENIIATGFDVACQQLQILTDFQEEFVKKCQNLG